MSVRMMKGLLAGTLAIATAFAAGKGPSGKEKAIAGPKNGIKTPGVQIAFAGLKAEATVPAAGKPAWMYFVSGGSGSVYFGDAEKVEKIDTKTNKATDAIGGLKKPCGMVSAFGSLWVPTCGDGALQRIDAKTMKLTATIASGAAAIHGNIAASSDSIWLLTDEKETLSRIDPDQNQVTGEFRLPVGCTYLTFAENFLWVTCPAINKILKINPATNIVDKRIEVSANPIAITGGQNSLWVLCGKDGKIDRIDPKTDKVTKTIDLSAPATEGALTYGENYLWVTMPGFPVTRVDVTSESVAQQFWGEGGGAIATSPGALWLSNLSAGTISRIDPKLILATLAE